MKALAIFDLDNCTADDSHRIGLIDFKKKGDERYEAYHAMMGLDAPVHAELIHLHISEGKSIVFVTGRPEKYRKETCFWIENNLMAGCEYSLLMRHNNDHRSAPDLKIALILQIEEGSIKIAYDDREDVVQRYRSMGINCSRLYINDYFQIDAQEQEADNKIYAQKEAEESSNVFPEEMLSVAEILRSGADTYQQRNQLYGDSYKSFARVFMALFPSGSLNLSTQNQINRLGLLTMIISKLTRYCANMNGQGHKDSAHDMMVYSAMLEELTQDEPIPF